MGGVCAGGKLVKIGSKLEKNLASMEICVKPGFQDFCL